MSNTPNLKDFFAKHPVLADKVHSNPAAVFALTGAVAGVFVTLLLETVDPGCMSR